jgi:intracellular sulfur oxidation DsrE/DsrF family protein
VKVLLHAPTEGALTRARSNFRNLRRDNPGVEIRIIANAEAVPAAVKNPDPEADRALRLCENSLRARGLTAPEGMEIVAVAMRAIAELQQEGWIYIRA